MKIKIHLLSDLENLSDGQKNNLFNWQNIFKEIKAYLMCKKSLLHIK